MQKLLYCNHIGYGWMCRKEIHDVSVLWRWVGNYMSADQTNTNTKINVFCNSFFVMVSAYILRYLVHWFQHLTARKAKDKIFGVNSILFSHLH